jgi:RND family efflux transporter MFP subunit
VLFLLFAAPLARGQGGITAVTNPSADVTLSFVQAGRIAEVLVKEGDSVGKDQLLVRLDDAVEQLRLAQIKAQAEDTSQVEAAQASLEQKRVDLKRIEWAAERGAATDLEVEHARLEVRIAELSLKVAQFESEQNRRKHEEAEVQLARMHLKSPVAGIVERVHVEVGECVNGLADVVRVVQIDPLWIDVYVPMEQAARLSNGQTANVAFAGTKPTTSKGRIVFLSVVADSASSTLRSRIELANAALRPAGEHVQISFDSPADQPKGLAP